MRFSSTIALLALALPILSTPIPAGTISQGGQADLAHTDPVNKLPTSTFSEEEPGSVHFGSKIPTFLLEDKEDKSAHLKSRQWAALAEMAGSAFSKVGTAVTENAPKLMNGVKSVVKDGASNVASQGSASGGSSSCHQGSKGWCAYGHNAGTCSC